MHFSKASRSRLLDLEPSDNTTSDYVVELGLEWQLPMQHV